MAVIYPTASIEGASTRLNIKGSIIQMVDNTQTVGASFSQAWTNGLVTSITTSKANNKILVEYHMNHRSDQGLGTWSLVYHRILVSGAASGQVMYAGHMGAAAQHIYFYERSFMYDAGAVGTYTFTSSCYSWGGSAHSGSNSTGATNQYLRLYEIGT